MKRSQKRIPQINIAKAKRTQEKRTGFYRSPEWRALRKAVRERSGGRCERVVVIDVYPAGGIMTRTLVETMRCTRKASDVHHLRYTKVRAHATLSDLLDVCRSCHHELEAERPYRQARRRAIERASA